MESLKKIKILFLAEELAINGAMISLITLLHALPKDKYDLFLFLFNSEGELIKTLPPEIKLLKESPVYKTHRLSLKRAIKYNLKKGRIDLIFYRILVSIQRYFNLNFKLWNCLPKIKGQFDMAFCYNDGFVAPTLIKKVSAQKKGAWIHFPYSFWEQSLQTYEALKKMDVCIPVSIETQKDLFKVLQQQVPSFIVHNITDIESCRARASEPCEIPRTKDRNRIVSVGRVTPQKFFEVIPDTAQQLKEKGLTFEWFIIGDGPLRDKLIKEVSERGLQKEVHFIGARSNPMPWIKSADVFVNPSRWEAWGLTVSEALGLGKAVITSNIPVFSEQIEHEVNGLMVVPTPEIISDNIIEVLINDKLRTSLSENAKNYPFGKSKVIDEFNKMIQSLKSK